MRSVQTLADLGPSVVAPGHGRPCGGPADLYAFATNLSTLITTTWAFAPTRDPDRRRMVAHVSTNGPSASRRLRWVRAAGASGRAGQCSASLSHSPASARVEPMIVGIETGGTKVVCALAAAPREVIEVQTIPTTTPVQTIHRLTDTLTRWRASAPLDAVGLGAFGPIDLDPSSARFGTIGATPKPGWENTGLVAPVRAAAGCPVGVETDVTAAAIGEHRWGAGVGLADLGYVTVGTGVGVGAIVAGSPLHGTGHPEAGHLTVRRHPQDDFAGVCLMHGDCLEGLACGPAIAQRWGGTADHLGELLPAAVEVEAYYLAQLTTALLYVLSPARLVLGGGVMALPGLLDAVRRATAGLLRGALGDHPAADPSSGFLTRPALGDRAGVIGALTIAADVAAVGGRAG